MKNNDKNNDNALKKVELRDGGHDFDGIQELDNDLPKWWVNLFLITIAFGIGYFAWYHFPGTPALGPKEEYLADKIKLEKAIAVQNKSNDSGTKGFDFESAQKDSAIVATGKGIFDTNCAACHGQKGEGIVGPNLTDKYWIHGFTSPQLLEVVLNGVAEKGMPAWKQILGEKNAQNVLTYIATLQNTNPPNPKASQGTEGTIKW